MIVIPQAFFIFIAAMVLCYMVYKESLFSCAANVITSSFEIDTYGISTGAFFSRVDLFQEMVGNYFSDDDEIMLKTAFIRNNLYKKSLNDIYTNYHGTVINELINRSIKMYIQIRYALTIEDYKAAIRERAALKLYLIVVINTIYNTLAHSGLEIYFREGVIIE